MNKVEKLVKASKLGICSKKTPKPTTDTVDTDNESQHCPVAN